MAGPGFFFLSIEMHLNVRQTVHWNADHFECGTARPLSGHILSMKLTCVHCSTGPIDYVRLYSLVIWSFHHNHDQSVISTSENKENPLAQTCKRCFLVAWLPLQCDGPSVHFLASLHASDAVRFGPCGFRCVNGKCRRIVVPFNALSKHFRHDSTVFHR